MNAVETENKHRECVLCGRNIGGNVKLGAVFTGVCIDKQAGGIAFVMFGMCREHFNDYMSKKLESISPGKEIENCLMCGAGEPDVILQVNVESDKYTAEAAFGLCVECWGQWAKYMKKGESDYKKCEGGPRELKLSTKMKILKEITIALLKISLYFHNKYLQCCEGNTDASMLMEIELRKILVENDDD